MNKVTCTQCPSTADMDNVRSLYGWQIAPAIICVHCIQKAQEKQTADRIRTERPALVYIHTSSHLGRVISTLTIK